MITRSVMGLGPFPVGAKSSHRAKTTSRYTCSDIVLFRKGLVKLNITGHCGTERSGMNSIAVTMASYKELTGNVKNMWIEHSTKRVTPAGTLYMPTISGLKFRPLDELQLTNQTSSLQKDEPTSTPT